MFNMLSFKTIIIVTSGLLIVPRSDFGFSQELGVRYRTFYILPNSSLVGNVKETRKVKDSVDCSFLCLEHGLFVCLSFNFGKANESGYYTCELSNSERYLEPHKIQEQPSSDYYGTTAEVSYKLAICKMGNLPLLNHTDQSDLQIFFLYNPLPLLGVDAHIFFIPNFWHSKSSLTCFP